MTALKPCPFCRKDRYAQPCGTGEDYDSSPDFFVGCSFCGANGPLQPTEANAVRLWNTRPPLASDEELRVLQCAVDDAYAEARRYAEAHRYWSDCCLTGSPPPVSARVHAALATISAQRRSATLSALERRLRGVE